VLSKGLAAPENEEKKKRGELPKKLKGAGTTPKGFNQGEGAAAPIINTGRQGENGLVKE